MDTLRKLELLKDTYSDQAELDRILGKLLEIALSQHRQKLERYEQDLREFQQRYRMDSAGFYQRFEIGELGDNIDFFEWSSLYLTFRTLYCHIRFFRDLERVFCNLKHI